MLETKRKTAAEMVAEAKGCVENLTAEQVAAELEKNGTVLVDLREGEGLIRTRRSPER